MSIDLSAMSRKELEKLGRDVEKAIATLGDRERKAALDAAEKAAAEHGFSLAELAGMSSGKSKSSKPKSPPKFRNPANPDQTWSGRGRRPDWIKEAEAAGRPMSDFAICPE